MLFDREDDSRPARLIPIDPAVNRTYHYWHAFVPGEAAVSHDPECLLVVRSISSCRRWATETRTHGTGGLTRALTRRTRSSNGRARRRFRAPLCGRALRSRGRHNKSKRPIGLSPGVKSSTMSRAWTYLVPGSCADLGPWLPARPHPPPALHSPEAVPDRSLPRLAGTPAFERCLPPRAVPHGPVQSRTSRVRRSPSRSDDPNVSACYAL